MTLQEMAVGYRDSGALLKERIALLRERLKNEPMCQMEKLRLRIRIDTLSAIMREVNETAVVLERYYEKGYRRNGRYTLQK